MKDPDFHGRPLTKRRAEAYLWHQQAPNKERRFGVLLKVEEMQAAITPDRALALAARLVRVAERAKAEQERMEQGNQ